MLSKKHASKNLPVLSVIALSTLCFSSMSHAGNIKVEPSSIAMVDPYDVPDIQKTHDGYHANADFMYKNKDMNIDVIVDDDLDQSVLLFNETKKNFEVYKVVVDHQRDGEYDFYGYEGITGTISLDDGVYQFDMKDKTPLASFNIRKID